MSGEDRTALASELGLISGRRVGYKANGRCSNSHLRGNSACARKDVESQGCGPAVTGTRGAVGKGGGEGVGHWNPTTEGKKTTHRFCT